MKKLFTLTLIAIIISTCNTMAQGVPTGFTGLTKYIPVVFANNMPQSYYVYNGIMYFSTTNSYNNNQISRDLWSMDGTTMVRQNLSQKVSFPFFQIIGGRGDSLIMLVNDNTNYPITEGIYAYDIKNGKLNLISQQKGISYLYPLLTENNKVYYLGKTATAQAIYRFDISTFKTDTFCHLSNDLYGIKLYCFNNKYYASQRLVDMATSTFYCDIYIVDAANKRFFPTPITPTTSEVFTDMVQNYNDLYFVGYSKQNGAELYKYSGSLPATRLTDINTDTNILGGSSFDESMGLVLYNNRIYFSAMDDKVVGSLYEYDLATNTVKFIYNNNLPSFDKFYPRDFYVFNNRLYMFGRDVGAHQPYVYDGTKMQRVGVLALSYNLNSYFPRNYTAYKGDLYFSASDTFSNVQMYRFNDAHLGPKPQGIANVSVPIHATVYPNPVTQNAGLVITLNEQQTLSVQLTDMSGRVVYTKELQSYRAGDHIITLPIQQLSAGTYVYTLANEDGVISSGKLLKQ